MGPENKAFDRNVQMYAYKRFKNVIKMSCNDAVIGDLESYHI